MDEETQRWAGGKLPSEHEREIIEARRRKNRAEGQRPTPGSDRTDLESHRIPEDLVASRSDQDTSAKRYSADCLARAWWNGVNDQWKHRPIGNRIPETENPYRQVSDPQRRNGV